MNTNLLNTFFLFHRILYAPINLIDNFPHGRKFVYPDILKLFIKSSIIPV